MREVCAQHDGGLEVLSTVPYDSRTAPQGVVVTRHTIFAAVAKGLLARGVTPPPGTSSGSFGEHLCNEFSALLEARLLCADEVRGATALLKHLAAHGVPCYVNTATPQQPIDKLVDALGWRRYFRTVLGSPGTKLSNLAAIAADAGISGAELVHVGDGDNDCKAAAEFGCRFVGIVLDPASGGNGKPDGGFTRPCAAVGCNLEELAPRLCTMLGLPSPTRWLPCRCVTDLGFQLSETSTNWPTCKPLAREVIKSPDTTSGPGARGKQAFSLNGGSGTHIDAPAHFIVGGRTVDQLSLVELANVPLAVIDATRPCADAEAGRGIKRKRIADGATAGSDTVGDDELQKTAVLADAMVGIEAIAADEAACGRIPHGALVVIRTGWAAARYEDEAAYYNATDPTDIDAYTQLPRMHYPGLAADAARMLVLERGAVGIGVDTLSPDGGDGPARGFPTHHAILGADRYILENLHLPEGLPCRGATAIVAPLNVVGAPETPARVWAVLP